VRRSTEARDRQRDEHADDRRDDPAEVEHVLVADAQPTREDQS
jgi:hypothetical protein